MGLPIIMTNGPQRMLVAAAEALSPQRLAWMVQDGTAELALTQWRAETLKIRVYDDDLARIVLAPDTDQAALKALIDPVDDLATPMKGPFRASREGDASIARAGLALAKSARILPAVILRPALHAHPDLTQIDVADLTATPQQRPIDVVAARLPLAVAEDTVLHVYRPGDTGPEHYALEIGRPDRAAPVLTRLHSACFTGDVLGSLKCDCGPQLHAAMEGMAAQGGGVLLYLNQEGRGIGLANKMRAYALQDQGFDTVEANHRLGFDDDERDFSVGAAMLRHLGIGSVRLMTNNPRKLARLQVEGIHVAERVPLWVGQSQHNRDYLRVKADRSGHLE